MMETISRREVLLGGSALMGMGLLPAGGLIRSAIAEEFPRPEYVIRAGTNENPWGPSRVALRAIVDSIKLSSLYGGRRRELTALLSAINNIPQEFISIGTGSGEILRVAGMLTVMDQGSVVCADPTYHDLVRYAEQAGSEIIRVPVNPETLDTDLNALYNAIRPDTKCVYIANPNNPIPSVIREKELRDFTLEVSKERLVFIDEAYFEFVADPEYGSMMDLVRDGHKNIVVARTASKIHGLAGLRVGFGFAHPDLTARINASKTGAINQIGVSAALASYQDQEFQEFTIRKNRESLDIMEEMLDDLGARYIKSEANFIFIHTGRPIQQVRQQFLEHNVMVARPFPPMTDWVRISMAKPEEMRYIAQVYRQILG